MLRATLNEHEVGLWHTLHEDPAVVAVERPVAVGNDPQHELAPPARRAGARRSQTRLEECAVLVVTDDQERVGAELAAGRVACPGCGGRLRPWGFGHRHVVRTSSGLEHVRARRAVCPACSVTHLLEPASALPRMRASAEVVGGRLVSQGRRGRLPEHRGYARPAGAGREALAMAPRLSGRSALGGRYRLALPVPPARPAARACRLAARGRAGAGRACGRCAHLEARAEAAVAHSGHPDRRPRRLMGSATGLPPPFGSGSLAPPARPQGRLRAAGVGTGGFRQLNLGVPGRPCGRWPGAAAPRRPSRDGTPTL